MKKIGKQVFGAFVAAGIVLSFSGCSNKKTEQASIVTDVKFPLEQKATLSFITSANSGTTMNPNERIIFKRLQEQTNVEIKWTCFVQDQFYDKKNLALANVKALPDGLFNADMSDYDLLRYAKQGVIIPVEKLIDSNMPNLKKVLDENPEYRKMITAPDGHIYGLPWIEQLGSGKTAIQAIGGMPFINKKWLDKLKLPVPTTTAELEAALVAFKYNDMAGDGKTIPMSFIMNGGNEDMGFILGAFGEGYGDVPDHISVSNEKKVVYTPMQEGFKEGIKWMHSLAEQGLIDLEAYTQNWGTYVAKGKAGRYGVLFSWDCANIVDNPADYIPLPALKGPNGKKNAPRSSRSDTSGFQKGRSVLTSSCKNPSLAAAWLDLMYVPQQSAQNNWGSYGEEASDNIFEMLPNGNLRHLDLAGKSPNEIRNAQMVGGPLAILDAYYGNYVTCPADAQYRLDWIKDIYVPDMNQEYVYPNIFMSQEDLDNIAMWTTDLDTYVHRMKSEFVLNGNVDKNWDSYVKKLEQYGVKQYIETLQKNYDKVN